MSNYFACNVGVRKGENLSPLLFVIYLNDFDSFVSRNYNGLELRAEVHSTLNEGEVGTFLKLYVLLYTDDTIVLAETLEDLQICLNNVFNYCKKLYFLKELSFLEVKLDHTQTFYLETVY